MDWTQTDLHFFFFFGCKDVFFSLLDDHTTKNDIDDEVNEVDNVVTVDFHLLKQKVRKLKKLS